jgi:hypothetical protein
MRKSKEKSLSVKGAATGQALVVVETLDDHAAAIHALGKRVIEDVIEIGRRLTLAKPMAGHGKWLPWLKREFGWTEQSALNFMRAYELAKSKNFLDLNLPVSAIYQLAAPSTPPEAVEAVVARAKAGEKVTGADVKKVVGDAKIAKAGPSSPPSAAMRKAKLKKDKAEAAEGHDYDISQDAGSLSHDDEADLVEAVNGLIDKYGCDNVAWVTGQCSDLALVVKVLIEGHGFDAVRDAVLEYVQ